MAILSDIDWFEWNGYKCTNIGMRVLTQPTPVRAQERVTNIPIPGRAGSVTVTEGQHIYENIVLSATCIVDDPNGTISGNPLPGISTTGRSRISVITSWLSGEGKIVFANQPTGYYKARIVNQIPFDKVLRNHPNLLFQVQFQCDPFFYLHSGETTITASTSPFSIQNLGNIPSKPLLEISASTVNPATTGTISVGGYDMTIEFGTIPIYYHRPNLSAIGPGSGGYAQMARWYGTSTLQPISSISLDCDAKVAYSGGLGVKKPPIPRGMRVTGDWIELPTGTSSIQFDNKITEIKITPRWKAIH